MALGFPLYINLHGNNCVVLGGGEFAWERARTLLAFGAKVTVISPTLCEGLRRLDEEGKIRYIPRRYFRGDCTCAYLCVAATEDEALNIAISDECKAKGIFRKDNRKPLVGDNVEIEVLDEKEKEGSVTAILPRKNSLIRPAVANVDQAFVIFAMENPKPNFMLLDRFLIMMEQADIPVTICFNKKDLGTREELDFLYETYQSCGYKVILSSTYQGDGMEEIKKILQGKTTVVAGPSGVGKSSITNALQGNVQMETGEISKKLKRGKHTTRHSQVIPVGKDTYLVDTPGFSCLYLSDMEEQELKDFFPEFRKYEGQCRFQGCRHIHEPGCAVKEALDNHEISSLRYEDYLGLYEEKRKGDSDYVSVMSVYFISGF